jgi:protein tyrosine/serine phosphatase
VESSTYLSKLFQRAFLVLGLALATSCNCLHTIPGSDSWRSAQPSADQLRFVADQGVNSVISLRKAQPGKEWYDEEEAACRELGLNFRSLNWSALNDSSEQIDRLVQALQELPPPYLIHCKHGVDRSGLAAAVFRVVVLGHKKRDAGSELSLLNGHLPFLETQAMDRAWSRFRWPSDKSISPVRVVTAP